MKILITGICGFVGKSIAEHLAASMIGGCEITGIDNLLRAGSELNRWELRRHGIEYVHADLRSTSDIEALGAFDWVIDCAALPSVLAGTAGFGTSRQLVEHNLLGTLNLLELCRRAQAGLVLVSTSRVYSIEALSQLGLVVRNGAFQLDDSADFPVGLSSKGIGESFSTAAPISLYGATKLASETMAREYSLAFDFPLWINRCGVIAGAGQFARPDQGIYSYWIHSYCLRRPLRFIGFEGQGYQVRDVVHPRDLADLIIQQLNDGGAQEKPITVNVSGGVSSARSLSQLSDWCEARFGTMSIDRDLTPRPYDLPWVVLDSTLAHDTWNWRPKIAVEAILDEIARYAEQHPDWLDRSMG